LLNGKTSKNTEIKVIAIRHQLFKILLLQALFEIFKLEENSVSTRS